MTFAAVLLALAVGPPAMAAAIVTPPRPVDARPPQVPQDGGGWVRVSFVVLPDGTVDDLLVLDASGTAALEAAVTSAVAAWKFDPATENGVAVARRVDERLVVLKTSPDSPRVQQRRKAEFRRIGRLIDKGRLDEAQVAIERLRDQRDLSYPAWGEIHLMLARVATARGDRPREVADLLEAIRYLPAWQGIAALRSLFAAQVELRLYRSAQRTHAVLQAYGGTTPEIDATAAGIRRLVAGDQAFVVPGEIPAGTSGAVAWSYEILGQQVGLAQVDGVLERIEIRCAERGFIDAAEVDKEWTVPTSWGDCAILVFGRPGTRFVLVESPAAAPATP